MEHIESGMARLAKEIDRPAPVPDGAGRYVLAFADGLVLRAFAIPGREVIFEGPVAPVPPALDQSDALCRTMLQVSLARYREKPGELYHDTEAHELVYARHYMPGESERLDFIAEAESFLNELSLMRGRALGTGGSSGMGGMFSFRR